MLSRAAEGLVQRLLELEVPEIADGTVEIMAIARDAGSRSKVAVQQHRARSIRSARASGRNRAASPTSPTNCAARRSTSSATMPIRRHSS